MASIKPRQTRSINAKATPQRKRAPQPLADTPDFLIRLVGRRQARTLAARTGVRHRHD